MRKNIYCYHVFKCVSYLHQNRHSSIDYCDEEEFYPPLKRDTNNLYKERDRERDTPMLIIRLYVTATLC